MHQLEDIHPAPAKKPLVLPRPLLRRPVSLEVDPLARRRQMRLDQLLPPLPLLNRKVDVLRRRTVQLVPPQHRPVAVSRDDRLLGLLQHLRLKIEPRHRIERPAQRHIETKVQRQILLLADMPLLLPHLQRIPPEMLEQPDPIHRLAPQNVVDSLPTGQFSHLSSFSYSG